MLSIALEVSRAANSRRARKPPDERHGPKSQSRPPETAAPELANHLEAPQSPRTRTSAVAVALKRSRIGGLDEAGLLQC